MSDPGPAHRILKIRFAAVALISVCLLSCNQQNETQLDVRPGLGEIMSAIQQHHAKLYYSASEGNWELADYELGEIKEGLEDAQKSHHPFKALKVPLTQLIPEMTKATLEAVDASVQHKDKAEFIKAFHALTASCNHCHQVAEHPFIVIQVPTHPEFTNQRFSK